MASRMKRIHRLIYQEIGPPTTIALLVLTFVVFTRDFGRISKLFIQQGAEAGTALDIILGLLPAILVYTVPIAFLIGTLVGFSRLSTDSEVVALRAGGVSIFQIIWPVIKVAAGVAAITASLTFYFFPWGNWKYTEVRKDLGARPVQSEIKPRIFFEDLPGKVLYIEDQVLQSMEWKGVFLADTSSSQESDGGAERIVLARGGRLIVSPDNQRLQLDFEGGLSYEINPEAPETYHWNRFARLEVPLPQDETTDQPDRRKRPREMYLDELLLDVRQGTPTQRRFGLVELNRRLALPVSALLFGILGVTLGARPHRGGRGYGIVVGLTVAFAYYALLSSGVKMSEDRVVTVGLGIWGPNLLLALIASLSLRFVQYDAGPLSGLNGPSLLSRLAGKVRLLGKRVGNWLMGLRSGLRRAVWRVSSLLPRVARVIDLYVMRTFFMYLLATLLACMGLYYLFTFFDLINDIFTNDISYGTVAEYFTFLMPQALTLLVPISTLIATLICFGVLLKTNQLTAMKACGISLYQVILPVIGLAVIISGFSYLNHEYVLPYANQRQDLLRSRIKGRPIQTHYSPQSRWIFGKSSNLYNYEHYDADRDRFAKLSIYDLQVGGNDLDSHVFARQATWDRAAQSWRLIDGWKLDFAKGEGGDRFERFEQILLKLDEAPDYFETEVKESSKMTYSELRSYIAKLQQSGFEVDHLKTELYTKLSFPLVPLIMTLLGVPFAFTLGKKGALYGIAVGVVIGMIYWGAFGVFGVLGAGGLLAPMLAAWGPNMIFVAGAAFLVLNVRT